MAKKDYSFNWRSLSYNEMKYLLDRWSKTANRRIRRLKEKGIDFYENYELGKWLKNIGRKTIPNSKSKNMNPGVLMSNLEITQRFLLNQSSTLSGIKKISDNIYDKVHARLEQFLPEEFSEKKEIGNKEKFYDFLHSDAFKQAREKIDSDLIVSDYANYWQELDNNELSYAFEKYLMNEIGYDEIREMREGGIDGKIK